MLVGSFVAEFQASVVAEPCEATFDHPAEDTQARAMLRADPSQERHDSAFTTGGNVLRRAVGPIAQRSIGFSRGRPRRVALRWHIDVP